MLLVKFIKTSHHYLLYLLLNRAPYLGSVLEFRLKIIKMSLIFNETFLILTIGALCTLFF